MKKKLNALKSWVINISLFAIISVLTLNCANEKKEDKQVEVVKPEEKVEEKGIQKENFQKVVDGKKVDLVILKNSKGLEVTICNYGAMILSILAPDKDGNIADIVTGMGNIDEYVEGKGKYFGSIVGRYANRIAKGKFTLDGVDYSLIKNNGPNHLHGGRKGFNSVVWDIVESSESSVKLQYMAKDMEEGYPGNFTVEVVYTLEDDNGLKIEYAATTDKKTVLNITNHAFFNLAGDDQGLINDHLLTINADNFTPVDSTLIPTGVIAPVKSTPLDFTSEKTIEQDLNSDHQQMVFGGGYDHNFVLNKEVEGELSFAARAKDPKSGRVLEVYTTEPGIQFYGGNFLTGVDVGKSGKAYKYRTSFCLETQHFPDSPNQPNFPSTVLEPGQKYESTTIYKFLAE